jgi:hypothetical protein
MHTCTHAHMHTCTHVHMHTCSHAHMFTCMLTYTPALMLINTTHTHVTVQKRPPTHNTSMPLGPYLREQLAGCHTQGGLVAATAEHGARLHRLTIRLPVGLSRRQQLVEHEGLQQVGRRGRQQGDNKETEGGGSEEAWDTTRTRRGGGGSAPTTTAAGGGGGARTGTAMGHTRGLQNVRFAFTTTIAGKGFGSGSQCEGEYIGK